ncbi:serine hydrolase [Streptomyces sp. NPDC052301]|uniref:serine hydrolase n=1 Tax=Streptomyces sp. NPDC052301 TaxID=3365687 RepID=UPI0037CD4AE9
MTHRISGRTGALVAALAAAVLAPAVAVPAAAAPTPAPAVSCTSGTAGLAAKLTKDLTAALKNRKGLVALGLYDRSGSTTCTLNGATAFDSASTVKVTVLAALLWDAKKSDRHLTDTESDLATAMITQSDNDATSALWKQLGVAKIQGFLTAAGMTRTTPGADGYWGLTQENITDEQKLLKLVTAKNSVLSDNSRAYILKLMGQVEADQRWGTPAGAPSSVSVHVKNGWLQRSTHGWRVHSLGTFNGAGHDYMISVFTQDNSTMDDGVATIQSVATAIHKDLVPAKSGVTRYTPTSRPHEAFVATPPRT